MKLKQTVTTFVETYATTNETLVVGVSGGKDSMTLLHILHSLTGSHVLARTKLIAVHVHHGLRDSAERDASFVESYCRKEGIACVVTRVEVDKDAPEGVESAARSARYRALIDVAAKCDRSAIVLGHHLDDQLETFLLRWLRGTGLHGLGAMRDVSKREGVPILRPLLSIPRALIEAYVWRLQLPFVDDETNDDERYRRNYLRHTVIPALRQVQPELASVTRRMTLQLQMEDDYLQLQSHKLYREIVHRKSDNLMEVDIRDLVDLHSSLQRRTIHLILNCFASDGWAQQHIDSILRLVAPHSKPSASVQLPKAVCAWRNYETLYIGFKSVDGTDSYQQRNWSFQYDQRLILESAGALWRFRRVRFQSNWHRLITKSNLWRLFLPNIEGVTVCTGVPTWQKIRPLGLDGSKKLQDVFTDAKVPRYLRADWPVFKCDDELLWLPGLVRSDYGLLDGNGDNGWIVLAYVDAQRRGEVPTLSDNPRRIIKE